MKFLGLTPKKGSSYPLQVRFAKKSECGLFPEASGLSLRVQTQVQIQIQIQIQKSYCPLIARNRIVLKQLK